MFGHVERMDEYRIARRARKIWRSGEPWCICGWLGLTWPFMLGPAFFRTTLPRSGRLWPGEGWDAVSWYVCGKLWRKGRNYWKLRRRCLIYGLRCVCWLIVCVIFRNNMTYPFLDEGRKSWYIIIIGIIIIITINSHCKSISILPMVWLIVRLFPE